MDLAPALSAARRARQHPDLVAEAALVGDREGAYDFAVTSVRVDAGHVLVQARGDVDVETAPAFQACLQTHLHPGGVPVVVVDLRDVTFLGAAGVRALARARGAAAACGQTVQVQLSSTHRGPSRALYLTGLLDVLQVTFDD